MQANATRGFQRLLSLHRCGISVNRYSSSASKILAIRREDSTVWERRAPLAPSQVRKLVDDGYTVLVQPSNRRAYPMQEYIKNGGEVVEDISPASVILGVKQVPVDLLIPNKTYVFFSHTIKAQEANMPMLEAILEKKIRLIDYEKMVDEDGRRVVAFGNKAGVTGMINILHGLGLRLLALGHHTPFMHIGPAHNYRNSEMARQAIRDAGYEISLDMLPKSLGPLTFVFTGSGNVSQGAQEVFRELPYEYVKPEHLASVAKKGATNKLYACVVDVEDHLVHKNGKTLVKLDDFVENPQDYVSVFHRKIAPYTSVLVNGIYWGPGHPRLLTIPEAKTLIHPKPMPWLPSSSGCPNLPHRLLAICDISADIGGSVEFMRQCTSIDHPFILYDAVNNSSTENFQGDGVLICSIDNMPAQIPRESTHFFGSLLLPYIPEMMKSDATKPFSELESSPVVKNAVIASNGKLTSNYEYISSLRQASIKASRRQSAPSLSSNNRVLVLGSGYVSAPVVDYLTKDGDTQVTVASQVQEELNQLANTYPNMTPVLTEFHRSQEDIEDLVKSHNIVISLLPYNLHPHVAKMCIKHKTNMVTASYRLPNMMELHSQAVDANITVMNEVGVDPGIDHLLAMKCFDELKERGAKIKSFISYCGGLVAPEFTDDSPLRYKFNWSPRGVLSNVLSPAKWLQNGCIKEVAAGGSLLDHVTPMSFLPGFNLEGFANRDSTSYKELYNIGSCQTVLRGTVRYRGFADAMKGLHTLGFIDDNPHPLLHPNGAGLTWKEFICELIGQRKDIFQSTLTDMVYERVGQSGKRLRVIQDLGLMDDVLIDKQGSPLDTLSNYLSKRLAYNKGERDLLIMRHDIGVEWPDLSTQTHHVDFIHYGDPNGYSAMSATVGYPTAIATRMILNGEIQKKGMVLPFDREIYTPMLHRLEQLGLAAKERVSSDSYM